MSKQTYRIVGRVADREGGRGVGGLKVEAWDKDLLVNDLVASSVTDAEGNFRMEFAKSYFRDLFLDRRPDLFFKVYREGELIKSTEDSVLWNVSSPTTEVLIEVDAPQSGGAGAGGERPAAGGGETPGEAAGGGETPGEGEGAGAAGGRRSDALRRLVEQAREDPAFFHSLVFEPEKVLARLGYLDRGTKGALIAVDPEALISIMVGEAAMCGKTCGFTAGGCGGTCVCTKVDSCAVTCSFTAAAGLGRESVPGGLIGAGCGCTESNSCGYTCPNTCGMTTDFQLGQELVVRGFYRRPR